MISKPLVLTFGWLGSKERHMKQIEELYKDLNIEFKYLIQSHLSILGIKENKKKFIEIYEYSKNRNIFCHIFSLNGLSSISKSLLKEDLTFFSNLNIKGIIWDSSPGKISKNLYHKSFAKAIFPNNKILENVSSLLFQPSFYLFNNLFKKNNLNSLNKINLLYKKPFNYPQLIFASKNDQIISFNDINEYLNICKNKNIKINFKFWNDSGHIRLFKDYPIEYKEILNKFIKKNVA